jgi:hypothetical protein
MKKQNQKKQCAHKQQIHLIDLSIKIVRDTFNYLRTNRNNGNLG